MIFDSHAHYESEQFDADRAELLGSVLPQKGVCCVINMGSDMASLQQTVDLCDKYDYFYGAVGIHPECAGDLPEDWLQQVEKLLSHPKIVAVGEIGLDYYWDTTTKDAQKVLFQQHIDLACQLKKPLVIHDREAHGDTLDILKNSNARQVGGILHAFSGSVEMALEVIKLGFYIGLGGPVTFKNARKTVEVAAAIPLDHLVIETDCPYMAPVPFRGKRNEPMLVQHTAAKIAEIRGISVEELVEATYQNGKRIYGIQ